MSRVETIAAEAENDLPDGFPLVPARHFAEGLLQCMESFRFILHHGRVITKLIF
jgi:hypothetical protein